MDKQINVCRPNLPSKSLERSSELSKILGRGEQIWIEKLRALQCIFGIAGFRESANQPRKPSKNNQKNQETNAVIERKGHGGVSK